MARTGGTETAQTEETEIEIAIGDPGPEKAIVGEPVQAVAAASAPGGARATTAGTEAAAEIEEAVIVSPGQEQLEPKKIRRDGEPRAVQPSKPQDETDMTAEPSAMPAQATREKSVMELWCPGLWKTLPMIFISAALVIAYVIQMFGELPRW